MPPSNRPWTVLVVDDSEEFREAACAWMRTRPEFDVVGTAGDGEEALRRVEGLRPDLVLMDAMMPILDGFEATRRLKSYDGSPAVVIVSFHDAEVVRREAWAAGADGFVAKSELTGRLPGVVRGLREPAREDRSGPRPRRRPDGREERPEEP